MNQVDYLNLINSVKQDDLVLFSAFVSGNEDICFGRFPLLSLCYLYDAKKITKKYESDLIKVNKYYVVTEPLEVYNKFKTVAGRTLRLYTKAYSMVSPIEMLAILHKDSLVKKHFKNYSNSETIINNLNSIYVIYKQKAIITSFNIKIGRQRLTKTQTIPYKIALCLTLSVMFVVSGLFALVGFTGGFGTNFSVAKIYTNTQLVKALKQGGNYELCNNIDLTGNSFTDKFNGTLNGNGYTINVNYNSGNNLIKTNNGTIKNLNLNYGNVQTQVNSNFSLLVENNNGEIQNVNITCLGLTLTCEKTNANGMCVSAYATKNDGIIQDCTLSFSAYVTGVYDGDAYIGGFAGTNNGKVKNCTFKNGEISTTEVDAGGIVAVNNLGGEVDGCKNYAQISQTSCAVVWSPTIAGVVAINYGNISNSVNSANLAVESTYSQSSNYTVLLGGISATNYGNICKCLSSGNLKATSNSLVIYCGGITAYTTLQSTESSMPTIYGCGSNSEIDVLVSSDLAYAMVGGISGFMYGQAKNCYSLSSYVTGFSETKYFIGTCFGACYADYYFIYDSWRLYIGDSQNNYVLNQENVSSQISAVITNAIQVLEITMSDSSILTLSSKQDIIESGVYWNE